MEFAAEYPDIHVSSLHPGVVATDFGLKALHGGVDSRNLPQAQPVHEVAEVIANPILHRRADVHTRPGAQQMVAAYYAAEDMGAAESAVSSWSLASEVISARPTTSSAHDTRCPIAQARLRYVSRALSVAPQIADL